MKRSEWHRVIRRQQIIRPCSYGQAEGKVSLLNILEVSEPFSALFNGRRITLADTGFSWVQLAMKNDFAWFTVMFDPAGNFLQIYADLTGGNDTDSDNPFFTDMYLDYVVCEGQVHQLDMDELENAFTSGVISEEMYRTALVRGKMLYEALAGHTEETVSFFEQLYEMLKDGRESPLALPVLSFITGEN